MNRFLSFFQSISMAKLEPTNELAILEELFLDQLNYKIRSVFSLQLVSRKHQNEIMSFMEELEELTKNNLELLGKKYV